MATTQTRSNGPAIDAAYEQFIAVARKAGNLYLDSYEKAVDRAIDLELKVAEATEQEWLRGLIETQAKFTKDLTTSYTTTARSLLK